MRDIDIKTMRLFAAVCEYRNMARAAAQEHIEASAISKRIAQLESDLGTTLLVRARRGVEPTAAGLAFLEHARTMLFTMDRIASDVVAFGAGIRGNVRLVATASAIAESLLDDVAAFMREPKHANIRIDIEERLTHELIRQLREGGSSVGVCGDSADLSGLERQRYRTDRLALAVHPDHPLAHRSSIAFEESLDHEHIGLIPSSTVHGVLKRAAMRVGRTVPYRAIVSNFDSAFRVVAANLGVSVIPLEVGRSFSSTLAVRFIPLTDAWARRQFVVCCQSREILQPAARHLVDHLVVQARRAADAVTAAA